MLTAVASWYANGIRADTQSPSTAYVTIHTHDRAAMSAEDNTSPALRARSSPESEGSAPISTNRCSGSGSRSNLRRNARSLTPRAWPHPHAAPPRALPARLGGHADAPTGRLRAPRLTGGHTPASPRGCFTGSPRRLGVNEPRSEPSSHLRGPALPALIAAQRGREPG